MQEAEKFGQRAQVILATCDANIDLPFGLAYQVTYIRLISAPHIYHHPPSLSFNVHPYVWCTTETGKESIFHKSELSIQSRMILVELRQEGSKATIKGVYNCLLKHRKL